MDGGLTVGSHSTVETFGYKWHADIYSVFIPFACNPGFFRKCIAASPSASCLKTSGIDWPNGMKGMCSMSRNDPPRGSVPWAKGLGALRQRVPNMAWPLEGRDSKGKYPKGKDPFFQASAMDDDIKKSYRM